MFRSSLSAPAFVCLSLLSPLPAQEGKGAQGPVLTEKMSGTTVALKKGNTLTVRLRSNPTTGFRWQIVGIDPEILVLQGKSKYEPGKPGLIGGGGQQTFRFRAADKGRTELVLIYHRTFEKGKKPAQTFRVQVEVD